MESLYLLIPVAAIFSLLAAGIFYWSVKSGQFDDLDTEGKRILFDDIPHKVNTDAKPPLATDESSTND